MHRYSVYLTFATQILWMLDLTLLSLSGRGATIANAQNADVRVFRTAGLLVYFLVRARRACALCVRSVRALRCRVAGAVPSCVAK